MVQRLLYMLAKAERLLAHAPEPIDLEQLAGALLALLIAPQRLLELAEQVREPAERPDLGRRPTGVALHHVPERRAGLELELIRDGVHGAAMAVHLPRRVQEPHPPDQPLHRREVRPLELIAERTARNADALGGLLDGDRMHRRVRE